MKPSKLSWDFMYLGFLGRCVSLAAFGALFGLLVVLGYGLRDNSESLTIMWPAFGILLAALWASPTRNWIWILATQLIVQTALYFAYADRANWQWAPLFAVANSVGGVVGAAVARLLLVAITEMPQMRLVLRMIASIAVGAAASAVVGAYASIHTSVGAHFLRQWQLWWANSWLGALFLAPVTLAWAIRLRPIDTRPAPAVRELLLIGGAQLGMTWWLFASTPAALSPVLDPQVLLLALVIVAAFRLPPRWATTLTALSVLIAAHFASRHLGPFSRERIHSSASAPCSCTFPRSS